MSERVKFKLGKMALLALKIGIGGSAAYYIAEFLNLEFASSAGIITLLTLQTTKWETIKLSVRRLFTYFLTFGMCMILCYLIRTPWLDYGVYLFVLVLFCESLGWRSTVSVNAVTAAHFLSTQDFSYESMMNEMLLVIIGITIAIILNQFHINDAHESGIIKAMRHTEDQMKKILKEMSGYLKNQPLGKHVWDDIRALEKELQDYLDMAHEYQNNTFVSHPEYYINYFQMRRMQCLILHNLHAEMRRLRNIPKQAQLIAEYMEDLSKYITEMNNPKMQMEQLDTLLAEMKNQPLPASRDEFESRALLYHVLMDLQDFLIIKKRFVESMDEKQLEIYWEKAITKK